MVEFGMRKFEIKYPLTMALGFWIISSGLSVASPALGVWELIREQTVSPKKGLGQGMERESILGRDVQRDSVKLIRSKRAPARHVGAVMAILGTFNEAGVLPPETDPRANQLIRSLIQFQSAFMKSQEPAVHEYLSLAVSKQWGEGGAEILESFYREGWTSESLEAVVSYSEQYSMWARPRIVTAFRAYYLTQMDWALIEEIFLHARQRLLSRHQDLHAVFAQQRLGFPGGKHGGKE